MAYDINLMPRTVDEWDQLIEHYASQSLQKHDAAVAAAKARAEAAWAALPADANRPALADYVAQAIACIEPAWSRADWEAHFKSVGYYPQAPAAEPAPDLATLRRRKLAELGAAFHTACLHAVVTTPDGWLADANEEANRNVDGLIKSLEATDPEATILFCDHANEFHTLGLNGLKAIQLLIIGKGQALYAAKWQYREAIRQAQDAAALAAIQPVFD